MCLAIPGKVVEVKNKKAVVRTDKHIHEVDLSLVKDVKVGDYLLAHADMAINKLSQKEAKDILKLINTI